MAAYRKVREIGLHDDDSMAGQPGVAAYLIARCHAALGELDHEVDLLGQAVPDLTDAQVAAGMMRLLPLLEDGHAYLEVPSGNAALSRALCSVSSMW